jgi:hypothetical protein
MPVSTPQHQQPPQQLPQTQQSPVYENQHEQQQEQQQQQQQQQRALTAPQHRKEDSLIDLSAEDQSYMRPSQPEPDRLYMNVNKSAASQSHQPEYQDTLRVSDQVSVHYFFHRH